LQPIDERSDSHVVLVVKHQSHLAPKITDIVFEALSDLHLDCEEVVAVLLEIPSGSIPVIESLLHLFDSGEIVSGVYRTSRRQRP